MSGNPVPSVPSPVQPSPAVTPEKATAAPAAAEPAQAAVPGPAPEPVGSLIGEEPKVEEPKEEGKEPPKEQPKVAEPAKEQPKEVPGPPKDGKYEPFKLPEGLELEPVALAEAQKFMAETLKLPQEAAQSLVDFHVKALQTEAEAPYRLWEKTQREWQDEVKADPVIGGDNLPNVKVRIAKLLDEFGDKGVKEALAYTGAGNNPAIIRTFYKLAEKLTEGTFVPSGGASQSARSAEQVFYPTMFEGKK